MRAAYKKAALYDLRSRADAQPAASVGTGGYGNRELFLSEPSVQGDQGIQGDSDPEQR